jgi:rare lipoprotein A
MMMAHLVERARSVLKARSQGSVALSLIGALGLSVALSGCSETQLLIHGAKQIKSQGQPSTVGSYKVGNPYQIKGVWYYPQVEDDYSETGVASWYGPGFHGKKTANGEIFDENLVSAAHRTLPMPSVVRVTNLGNGRSIVVRINDRGPFAHGRIIDLSRKAAQMLGFERQGTAKVRVSLLPSETEQARAVARGDRSAGQLASAPAPDAAPQGKVELTVLQPPTGASNSASTAPVTTVSVQNVNVGRVAEEISVLPIEQGTDLFVQAGSFSNRENATRLSARLSALGSSGVERAEVAGKVFYRVRLGPVATVEAADTLLERVIQAGFPGSQIVVD